MVSPDLPILQPFRDYAWHRLVTLPRPDRDGRTRIEPGLRRSRVFASVLAAHSQLGARAERPARSLTVALVRGPNDRRVHVLLGGQPRFPSVDEETARGAIPVLFPPGATAELVDPAEATRLLDQFGFWIRCSGERDALLHDQEQPDPESPAVRLQDLVAHIRGAFCWLVLATPVPADRLRQYKAELATELSVLRTRAASDLHQVELERGLNRYRGLARAEAIGAWDIHALVGGGSAADAESTAALLCAAANVSITPHVLAPTGSAAAIDRTWDGTVTAGRSQSPFIGPPDLLARLAEPPDVELPGIRLVTAHCFDVTPETPDGGGPVLGMVLDAAFAPSQPMTVPTDTLNRHAFICGATGSGKSQTSRGLLESLSRSDPPIPWLVIEPAKAEYARMSGRLRGVADVLVIRPGNLLAPPASINPLEPAPGFPLQSHADLIRALFVAAFEAQEPFPQILARALTLCYQKAGWDLITSIQHPRTKPKLFTDEPDEPARLRYPTLHDLHRTAREVIDTLGYGFEVQANVRGFVDVRIGSLRGGTPGRFFEGGHPLHIPELLDRNVVLELEDITNDQDKAFLMGAVLIRIIEHLRVKYRNRSAKSLQHVLLIEEAHRLLKNLQDGPAAAAVELFASLLAEIRAYGEGAVVVEQIPAKIVPDVIKNTALKIMHRLPALDDRLAVGGTMNLADDQSEAVVAFRPGTAAVTIDGADRPLLVQMASAEGRESTDGVTIVPPLAGRRRSQLCGSHCLEKACTLADIATSRRIQLDARATVWIDAIAVCLVIGLKPPKPRRETAAGWPQDSRLRQCALAHAVERAVDARRDLLRPWVDPDDFGTELLQVADAILHGVDRPIVEANRWRAGLFRYDDIENALRKAVGADAADQPRHSDTNAWASRGILLDGDSLDEQVTAFRQHPSRSAGQQVAFGDIKESGLLNAVRELTDAANAGALEQALRICVAEDPALFLRTVGDIFNPAEQTGARQ